MEINLIERKPTFIALNNKLFAEYFLVYRINDSFRVNDFSALKNKHQLFFQRIENKHQHLNLMFVDSVFVNILADLTLEVFLNNINSFQDYILSNDKIKIVDLLNENAFFNYKFSEFIHLLLYGDISSKKLFNKKLYTDRVFCLKNNFGELKYFSIYEQKELQLKLLNDMKIKIDYNLSSISKQEVKFCLKFSI